MFSKRPQAKCWQTSPPKSGGLDENLTFTVTMPAPTPPMKVTIVSKMFVSVTKKLAAFSMVIAPLWHHGSIAPRAPDLEKCPNLNLSFEVVLRAWGADAHAETIGNVYIQKLVRLCGPQQYTKYDNTKKPKLPKLQNLQNLNYTNHTYNKIFFSFF